jgi:hypothetical protein
MFGWAPTRRRHSTRISWWLAKNGMRDACLKGTCHALRDTGYHPLYGACAGVIVGRNRSRLGREIESRQQGRLPGSPERDTAQRGVGLVYIKNIFALCNNVLIE